VREDLKGSPLIDVLMCGIYRCVYVYVQRERESRDVWKCEDLRVLFFNGLVVRGIYVCVCVCVYRDRARERDVCVCVWILRAYL